MSGAAKRASGRDDDWPPMDHVVPLAADAVHVWRADIVDAAASVIPLEQSLDAAERARARAFHAASDANRYIVAHGTLRELLAGYTGVDRGAIRYETGPYGKPRLARGMTAVDVTFNMSHTHDVVVFAFAWGREVGVDVERWTPDVECLHLARHFFSRAESAALAALPRDAQRAGFFHCWSRKEAYIKATGLGVSHGLDHFDVTLAPGEGAALVADRCAPAAVQQWRMRDLGFAPGHSGAVVAHGTDWHLQRFRVTPAMLGA